MAPRRRSKNPSPWRVLGLWLLYAFVGIVIGVLLLGAGDGHLEVDKRTRTRFRTKVVAGVSGLLLATGVLGSVLMADPKANHVVATVMAAAGWPLGVIMTIAAWVMIVRDLRR